MKGVIVKSVVVICVTLAILVPLIIVGICYPVRYKDYVEKYAIEYSLDKYIVMSMIKTESDFRAGAVSSAGARGLMQILPSTAKEIAYKLNERYSEDSLYDVETSIRYGCYYLRYLLDIWGDYTLALASYNAGLSNVRGWLERVEYSTDGKTLLHIPYKETREYISKINFAKSIYSLKWD